MTSFRGTGFTLIMLMIIGMVKSRLLELKTYPTSMISDGIHDIPDANLRIAGDFNLSISTTTLYDEKRCESIYGFLPCADTMQEVSGVLATESAAQNQVAFGFSMYAGSTVITLTFIWGFHIILSKDTLRGKVSTQEDEHQDNSSTTKSLSLKQILTSLNDTGVNIDEGTGDLAVIMLLSLIPFATVELVGLTKSPIMILFALVLSGAFVVAYFIYQIGNPLIRARSLAYLKQENLQMRFIYHVQRLAENNLIDEQGNPNHKEFERIFNDADGNGDHRIEHNELEGLIEKLFVTENDYISKEYAKAEIMTHFDDDNSGRINLTEFEKGCTKWLDKWKNVSTKSDSSANNIWKMVEKIAIRKKRAEITRIDKIMPRIINQLLLAHHQLVKDGKPNTEKIEEIFSKYDEDINDEIKQDELKDFIRTFHFGVELDNDPVLNEIVKEFDKNNNKAIGKEEFVQGIVKWINKAIHHDPSITDPERAIAKLDEDTWKEFEVPKPIEKPKATILYVVFGVGIMYLISGAFIQSVIQFSNAANIPFRFTSFVMAPLAINTRMVITALLNVGVPHVTKNASLTFSEMYNGLVMNNLLGLSTLLTTVYIKELSWTYSDEVLSIMIPCAIIGLFAFSRDTYPLWASISAMLLYPISIYLYYLMGP